jgi:hypothetical protein
MIAKLSVALIVAISLGGAVAYSRSSGHPATPDKAAPNPETPACESAAQDACSCKQLWCPWCTA